ncbi:GFA family protein [Defluviimonas sp. SAOS-178_SWC]|uniref:GFA family protein n=1 Tax=Defluviimonas sp. SAOS-178_SWC TaxID=3121287 RepID=UPI0032213A21
MHEGRCTCGKVRYRMTDRPLFTHACHCTWCQRETGTAHALNAMIEADKVELLSGQPAEVLTPSSSGKGQTILRCPDCHVALWSYYPGAGRKIAFVRVGTLDDPGACPPDIHIFTSTKLPWYVLPDGVPAVPGYYDRNVYWSAGALARCDALLAR